MKLFLALLWIIGRTAVAKKAIEHSIKSKTSSVTPISMDVMYSCTFVNRWSSSRHPNDYPSNAHWSPPVLVTHDQTYVLWENGGLASSGIENVAESGSTGIVLSEIEAAGESIGDRTVGDIQFNNNQQRQTLGNIKVDSGHPYMSSVTMIAPSPDWFSGFNAIDLRNIKTGTWYRSISMETFPWDAGTETGDTYQLNNPAENPHIPIFQLTKTTVPQSTMVFKKNGNVLPVAQWDCSLVSEPSPPNLPSSTCQEVTKSCTVPSDCCSGLCVGGGGGKQCAGRGRKLRGGNV